MTRKKRIGVAHHNLMEKGGAEGVGMAVLEALQDHYDVTLLTLTQPDIAALNDYYNTAVDGQKIDIERVGWLMPALYERTNRFYLLKNAVFSRLVAQHAGKFDLVFSSYNELSLPGRSLQYIHHSMFHRWTTGDGSSPLYDMYDELCKAIEGFDTGMVGMNRLLANSAWIAGEIEQTYGTRPEVVYPPVDTEGFVDTPWEERENGFVTVGRVGPKKNVLRTIEIVASLHDRGHDVHLHVIGPPHGAAYMARVEEAAAQYEFVHIEGMMERQSLVELICEHRYGIHGKDHEHFGMAVAELAAGGTIPFVPNGGGQREIVHEREELLYETSEEAVEKIDHVLSDSELRTELHDEVGGIEERFGRERFKRRICEVVTEELDEPQPTARTAP